MGNWGKFITLFMAISLYASWGIAAEYLDISADEVRVYAQPDRSSEIITTLFKGDSVPVSKKSPSGFKKVLVQDGGRKKVGYISLSEIGRGGRSRKGPSVRGTRLGALRKKYAVGFAGGINYQYQGARDYSDGQESSASISALSGLSQQFGGFFDLPVSKNTSIRSFLEYKSVTVTGTATYRQSVTSSAPTDTYLEEKFLAIGAFVKSYLGSTSFWYGGGLEFDKGLSGTLKFGTYDPVTLSGSDLPSFLLVFGSVGMDLEITKSIFLTPDVRFGIIGNTTPMIFEVDGRLGIGYKL